MKKTVMFLVLTALLISCDKDEAAVSPKPDLVRSLSSTGAIGKVSCEIQAVCMIPSPKKGLSYISDSGPQAKQKSVTQVSGDISSMGSAIQSQMEVAYKECPVGFVVVQCQL